MKSIPHGKTSLKKEKRGKDGNEQKSNLFGFWVSPNSYCLPIPTAPQISPFPISVAIHIRVLKCWCVAKVNSREML